MGRMLPASAPPLARLALCLTIATAFLLDPASAVTAAFFTAAAVGAHGTCTGASSDLTVSECNAWQDLRAATGAAGWSPGCIGAQYQLDP